MEDLTRDWKKLSLTEKEGDKLHLSKNKKAQAFVLAAKFFTHRSLNVKAVVKNFRPLWRTGNAFEVSDAGDNKLLFAFQSAENHGLLTDTWLFFNDMI